MFFILASCFQDGRRRTRTRTRSRSISSCKEGGCGFSVQSRFSLNCSGAENNARRVRCITLPVIG